MKISKTNYEEYIVSSLEGVLTIGEQAALDTFLGEHPELKQELNTYKRVFLNPDTTIIYPDKLLLLKTEQREAVAPSYRNPSAKINRFNYEEYVVRSLEGMLTTEEQASLDTFLYRHPDLKFEADAYKQAFLVPDKTVKYPDKASLFKQEPERVYAPFYRRYPVLLSMAATILLLLVFRIFLYNDMFSSRPGATSVALASDNQQTAEPTFATSTPGRHVDEYFIPSTGNPQVINPIQDQAYSGNTNQPLLIQTAALNTSFPDMRVKHSGYIAQKQNVHFTPLPANASQQAQAEAEHLIAQRNQSALISNAALVGKTLLHLSGRQLPGAANQTAGQQYHVVTVSYDSKDFSFVKIIH